VKQAIWGIVIVTVLLSLGCARKFDASSEESQKESIAAMREALPEDQRDKFERSLLLVTMDGLSLSDMGNENILAGRMSRLDGKTAEQIIAEADNIVAAREAKEREQALQEIAELEKKQQKAKSDAEALKKFEVLRSRFSQHYDRYSIRAQPRIELSLKNGTDHAVARVFARGTLATPGRTVPWLKEEFNFSIAGGIEPGETYETILEPNMFSDWGKVDPPSDAVFTVEIVELDGNDNVELLSARSFSESDQKRLEELRKSFN